MYANTHAHTHATIFLCIELTLLDVTKAVNTQMSKSIKLHEWDKSHVAVVGQELLTLGH